MHPILSPVQLASIDEARHAEDSITLDRAAPSGRRFRTKRLGVSGDDDGLRVQGSFTGGVGDDAALSEVEALGEALAEQPGNGR